LSNVLQPSFFTYDEQKKAYQVVLHTHIYVSIHVKQLYVSFILSKDDNDYREHEG